VPNLTSCKFLIKPPSRTERQLALRNHSEIGIVFRPVHNGGHSNSAARWQNLVKVHHHLINRPLFCVGGPLKVFFYFFYFSPFRSKQLLLCSHSIRLGFAIYGTLLAVLTIGWLHPLKLFLALCVMCQPIFYVNPFSSSKPKRVFYCVCIVFLLSNRCQFHLIIYGTM
jgi:hypothetical protein